MNSTGRPRVSATARYAEASRCCPFFAFASALARSRCSVHQAPEADLVHLQPLLGGHLEGQVDREAVGVVQREGAVPDSWVPPVDFTSVAARSKIWVPARRVCRKASSSA